MKNIFKTHFSIQVSPQYEYGAQQALNFLTVMDADALETSHPISVEVENPTQIAEIFDAIRLPDVRDIS